MEQNTPQIDEAKSRRDSLRERLRAKCEKIVAAVEALPEPKTYLEAERAARMVILADKMVERVFSEPKAVKEDVRLKAGRIQKVPVDAPFVSFAATSPSRTVVNNGSKGEYEVGETPLSKTYLKLEQLAAKITALDAEFNGQKSTKLSP